MIYDFGPWTRSSESTAIKHYFTLMYVSMLLTEIYKLQQLTGFELHARKIEICDL